jgi:hypothetical protein
MKTIDYVKKYNLDKGPNFDHKEFISDLTNDFISLLEYSKAENNLKGFENALRCISDRYKGIEKKTAGIFPPKLWNYFYATVVVKLRDELCPKQMQQRKEESEKRKRLYEERKRFHDEHFGFDYSNLFLAFLFSSSKPTESFAVLGLNENANAEEVKIAYKALALKHHPDKGGKQEDFIRITEAKNKVLAYLQK